MDADLCVNFSHSDMFSNFPFAEHEYPDYKPFSLSASDIVKIVFYALLFIFSLVGNVSIIVIAAVNVQLRSAMNAYLVNLAVADICIVLFCVWVHIVIHTTGPFFILGRFWCKSNGFVQMTSLTASVLTLTAIACDRFSAVMFPLQARRLRGVFRTSVVIGLIWLVSACVALPLLIYRDLVTIQWKDVLEITCQDTWTVTWKYDQSSGHCVRTHEHKIAYYTMVTLALFFAPIAIMGVTYSLIVWRLWVSRMPDVDGTSRVHTQHNAKKKVVKMVLMVLLVFVVCWGPFQVIVLFGILNQGKELPSWFASLEFSAYFLAYSNSMWNPVLYGGYNNAFRRGFARLFRCRKPSVVANGMQLRPRATSTLASTRTTNVTGSLSRVRASSNSCI